MTSLSDFVLIWSHEHKLWWRPNKGGYTRKESEAGLYTREEAKEICKSYGDKNRKDEEAVEICSSKAVASHLQNNRSPDHNKE